MPVPEPQERGPLAAESPPGTDLILLVIEDDPAGTFTVPELPASAGTRIRVRTARNLTEAERLLTDDVDCILLDLALPTGAEARTARAGTARGTARAAWGTAGTARGTTRTAQGTTGTAARGATGAAQGAAGPAGAGAPEGTDALATLRHVLRLAPRHAVLALTARDDTELAAEAVRVGAQDYLFRGELDERLLSRAVRYAVERKRADLAQHQLTESRLRAEENARLERGLLPTPLLDGADLRFAARYRPGRSRALLGGDFYDTVRTPDGTVHAMIGDVCGHGPDEAALGVELRIAWRALTLAGLYGDELLATLQQVLEHERDSEEIFATLCTVDIAPDGRHAGLCLAGHPAPVLARHGQAARLLPHDDGGPALGLLPHARWPRRQMDLGGCWSLMMYTDGLIEGRVGDGTRRLGQEGMVAMIDRQRAEGLTGEDLLEAAVTRVRELNGGELTDDVAVLLLDRDQDQICRYAGPGRGAHTGHGSGPYADRVPSDGPGPCADRNPDIEPGSCTHRDPNTDPGPNTELNPDTGAGPGPDVGRGPDDDRGRSIPRPRTRSVPPMNAAGAAFRQRPPL
ncbi:SpoIIE family protein phosphatase [Streptomyces sp. NPDC052042]|uniref:PP2C family protein-serine/threonine phosphatase n=1 Tax=Streptomyces sp. NPDC052042 TaxID=3365683 RepID=UPI0037D56FDC